MPSFEVHQGLLDHSADFPPIFLSLEKCILKPEKRVLTKQLGLISLSLETKRMNALNKEKLF